MKFVCEKHLLYTACLTASRAAASKSPNPSLEGLLFTATDMLKVTGYNLVKAIYSSIEADIQQQGSIVINASTMVDMLRLMPDGMVFFTVGDANAVHIKCGKSEYDIIGFSAEDYPEIPSLDAEKHITLPQSKLRSMISESIYAVSADEARPVYTGSLFDVRDGELNVVSVDGYRLAKRTEKLEGENNGEYSFIVPGSALSDVQRICTDDDTPLTIKVGKKHIGFEIGEICLISRRLEGEFMNYRRSIPDSFKFSVKVDRSELISVIERVAFIIKEKNQSPVRMSFNDGSIYCNCVTPLAKSEDVCTCEGSGEGLLIGFNDRYMREALKNAKSDELILSLNTETSPCVIKAADGSEGFTYMILPVRMRK